MVKVKGPCGGGGAESRTGWDQASSSKASAIETTTFQPAGRDTVHVAELLSISPRSALNDDDNVRNNTKMSLSRYGEGGRGGD